MGKQGSGGGRVRKVTIGGEGKGLSASISAGSGYSYK